MDTANLVAVVRSRWTLEVVAAQLAGVDGRRLSLQERFIFRALGEDLALVVARAVGQTLEFISASELVSLGLSVDAAIDAGWSNSMKRIAANGDVRFQTVPEFGWVPSVAGTDDCVTLLAQTTPFRSLPVTGRHLVFAPSTRGFWITDTRNPSGVERLCGIAANEYEQAQAKPLAAVPYVLGDDGRWTPWQPTPDDPSFWPVHELQVLQAGTQYEEQRLMLRRQWEQNPAAPHVAQFAADSFETAGKSCDYSFCVWGDCTTLLPKTDVVELKPLLNRAEMERDPNSQPQFGESIRVAWDVLAVHLAPQGMYPERYLATNFPTAAEFARLAQMQIRDPRQLFPVDRMAPPTVPATPATRYATTPAPPSGGVRAVHVLGAIAVAFFLMAGFAAVGVVLFIRAARPAPSPINPTQLSELMDAAKAARQQQDAVHEAIEDAQRRIQTFDDAQGKTNNTPLQEFPELPTPEVPLPALNVERRESISVANARPAGSKAFRDPLEGDAWLVGFRVVIGRDWGGVLRALQPIYQHEDRYLPGKYVGDPGGVSQDQILAKPGFAVSAIEIQRGLVFNSLRITFSRVNGSRLDLTDSYTSDWLGLNDNRPSETIAGEGCPILGIEGMYENGCFGDIRLIRSRTEDDGEPEVIEWLPVGEFGALPNASEPLPRFETTSRTTVAGRAGLSDVPGAVRDEASDGSWLVGFRVTTGNAFGGVLQSLRPIYQTGDTYELGKLLGAAGGEKQTQVLARPGYAVSEIELQRGAVVNCIRITFTRVVGERLDSADSNKTPWLGYSDTRAIESLSSGGEPLVGVIVMPADELLRDVQVIRAAVKPAKDQ